MKKEHKEKIREELVFWATKTSQNRLANKIGVSGATISQIINYNWKQINESMWRKIKVAMRLDFDWKIAPTRNLRDIYQLGLHAKNNHATISFSEKAGKGKTTGYRYLERNEDNVIYVEGSNTMSKKTYIKKMLSNAGQESVGTTEQLLEQFVDYVSELESPLIIMDQFDKLKEPNFDLFMDLYNELFGHCGFIVSGVGALSKRILRGVQRQKIGYEEIWSRMDKKFVELYEISQEDVNLIFQINGVNDEMTAIESYNGCEGDARRVRKDVLKYRLKAA